MGAAVRGPVGAGRIRIEYSLRTKTMRLLGFVFVFTGAVHVAACVEPPGMDALKPCPGNSAVGGRGGSGGEGGSAAAGGGGANQGGMGGDVGPAPECVMDSDCVGVLEAPDPRCGALRCTAEQKCAVEITEGPIASQRYGDCIQSICDSGGKVLDVDDSDDYFNDSSPCTIDFCQNGVSINLGLPDGSACPDIGDGYCYQGQCVECIALLPGAMCKAPGMACDETTCEPFALCGGGVCGGQCAPCAAGYPCATGADCWSGVCSANGMCELPACTDLTLNDGETDIDCGGPNCSPCIDSLGCAKHADCVSQVCMFAVCQAPSCFDGVQNGDEAGMDCGGVACAACLPFP